MRRLVWLALSLAVSLLLPPAAPLDAQTAVLLKDIETGDPGAASLFPRELTALGDKLFFLDRFKDLWVTDGTALGTRSLAFLCPLGCGSEERILGHNGRVLFFAVSEAHRLQLWRTDGTRPGTFRVSPAELNVVGEAGVVARGRYHFLACGEGGCGLWASDGTAAGTVQVLERAAPPESMIAAGRLVFATFGTELWRTDGAAGGNVLLGTFTRVGERWAVAGNRLFFLADDEQGGELWVSDGTAAGTRPLTRFAAADPFQDSGWVREAGGRIYFAADDGARGNEIWTTDGTVAGTRRLTDVRDELDISLPPVLAEVNGRLVFRNDAAPDRLWTVAVNAVAAAPVALCTAAACPAPPSALLAVGNRLVFTGGDGRGHEPWSTDGTPAGTTRLGDLCRGSCSGVAGSLSALLGEAYFAASRNGSDVELWASDGTAAGTRRVAGPEPRFTQAIAAAGGRLYFTAQDDAAGTELWTLDGSPAQPRRVADLGRAAAGSRPHNFAALGERVLFSACDAAGSRLWASAGEEATTLPLFLAQPGVCRLDESVIPVTAGGLAYFLAAEGSRWALWRTDGSPGGTLRLVQLQSQFRPSVAALPQGIVLAPSDSSAGLFELWASDGTVAGTRRIAELTSLPRGLTALGGEAVFSLDAAEFPNSEVWRTDGTPAGTRRIAMGDFSPPEVFFRWGADIGFLSSLLWRVDAGSGTAVPISDITADAPFVHRGALYFWAFSAGSERGVWRIDGAGQEARLMRSFPLDIATLGQETLGAAGDRLVFPADDGVHGVELWTSDGTPEGTTLLRDVYPGRASSAPSALTPAGGLSFFAAVDPVHGRELWQTDGTAAGTRLVQDLAPGLTFSSPVFPTPVGDRLYFSATDGETGQEPWYLPLPAAGAPPCQPGPERLCLGGGRFQVEVDWRDFGGRTGAGRAVPLTSDTGAFWFFDAANLELVVKVLDGNGLNGHSWVFYGALSSVEYTLTVTDTRTGAARRYLNQPGQLASVGDTQAFGPLGASAQTPLSLAPQAAPTLAVLPVVSERLDPAATVLCEPGPRRLCLNGGRFAVTATWKDFQDRTGEGTALPLTGDTGAFWFFDASNLEVLLKVIDGRGLNGKFWVFYGALSNVEYELTVTDSETGMVKTYRNPRGRFASAADTAAF